MCIAPEASRRIAVSLPASTHFHCLAGLPFTSPRQGAPSRRYTRQCLAPLRTIATGHECQTQCPLPHKEDDARAQIEYEIRACTTVSSLLRLVCRSQARILVTGAVPIVWERGNELAGVGLTNFGCDHADSRGQLHRQLWALTINFLGTADLPSLISLATSAGLPDTEVPGVRMALDNRLAALLRTLPSLRAPQALELVCLLPQGSTTQQRLLTACGFLFYEGETLSRLSTSCLLRLLLLAAQPADERIARAPQGLAPHILSVLEARLQSGVSPVEAIRALGTLGRLGTRRRLGCIPDLQPLARRLAHQASDLLPSLAPWDLVRFAKDVRMLCGRNFCGEDIIFSLAKSVRTAITNQPTPELLVALLEAVYSLSSNGSPPPRGTGLLQAAQRRIVHSVDAWGSEPMSRALFCFAQWAYDGRPGEAIEVMVLRLVTLAGDRTVTSRACLLRTLGALSTLAAQSPTVMGPARPSVLRFVATAAGRLVTEGSMSDHRSGLLGVLQALHALQIDVQSELTDRTVVECLGPALILAMRTLTARCCRREPGGIAELENLVGVASKARIPASSPLLLAAEGALLCALRSSRTLSFTLLPFYGRMCREMAVSPPEEIVTAWATVVSDWLPGLSPGNALTLLGTLDDMRCAVGHLPSELRRLCGPLLGKLPSCQAAHLFPELLLLQEGNGIRKRSVLKELKTHVVRRFLAI